MRLLRQGIYGRIEYGSVQEHALILYEADMLNLEYLQTLFDYYRYRESHGDEGKKIYKTLVTLLRPWDEDLVKDEIKELKAELEQLEDVKLGNIFHVDQRIIDEHTDYLKEAMSGKIPYQDK